MEYLNEVPSFIRQDVHAEIQARLLNGVMLHYLSEQSYEPIFHTNKYCGSRRIPKEYLIKEINKKLEWANINRPDCLCTLREYLKILKELGFSDNGSGGIREYIAQHRVDKLIISLGEVKEKYLNLLYKYDYNPLDWRVLRSREIKLKPRNI
jgi:hypothetical protein